MSYANYRARTCAKQKSAYESSLFAGAILELPFSFYVGIDGGGTNCRARLYDAKGNVLGEGQSGPANVRLGFDVAWHNIIEATNQCLVKNGLEADNFSRVAIGIGAAGVSSKQVCSAFQECAPNFGYINISSDAHIACLAAFDGKDGGIIISGTGSCGYAILGNKAHQIGGHGFELSDHGSSAALGRAALKACLLAYDGIGPCTDLTNFLLSEFGGKPSDVVAWVKTAKPKDYGKFAPIIMDFADKGDEVARNLAATAAQDLERIIYRLNQLGAEKICMVGGMAQRLAQWLAPWTKPILAAPKFDPTYGAYLLAKGANNGFNGKGK